MSRLSDRPVKAFSIGFGTPDFDEVEYAREVARRFGAEHHVFLVQPQAAGVLPTLVRHFGELGLLDGVASRSEEVFANESERP